MASPRGWVCWHDWSFRPDTNRALWDEWAEIHARSDWYNLDAVRRGECKLRPYEIDEVGDVGGKTLLHLQCQIGTDTICWARRGADVTGVDFSARAVAIATDLARELAVDARFVCADVLRLPDVLEAEFDVVYTSRGVLGWLPDLDRWATVVAHFLAPGGVFYLTDVHPVAKVFVNQDRPDRPRRAVTQVSVAAQHGRGRDGHCCRRSADRVPS